ncbi:MAG TPA: hypothetical protein VNT56_03360, partial [Acidimicrobiales bacterium]|nr:hypothetical protein [Acidimicrobiales bacterium]
MTHRRLALAVLASAGVLVAHSLGYALSAQGPAGLGHGYVLPALGVMGPVAVVVAALAAVAEARRTGLASEFSAARLAGAQLALFAVQEIAERLVSGHLDSIASEPGMLFGFLAQVPVAWVLHRLSGLAHRVASRLLAAPPVGQARQAVEHPGHRHLGQEAEQHPGLAGDGVEVARDQALGD